MTRVRRPKDLFFRLVEVPYFLLAELTSEECELRICQQAMACAPPTAGEQPVTDEELRVLLNTSSESWVPASGLAAGLDATESVLAVLVGKGLLLEEGSPSNEVGPLGDREERHRQTFWNPFASYYHFNAKWRDVTAGGLERRRRIMANVEGAPDPFFDTPGARARVPLPPVPEGAPLDELLKTRRTCRSFEPDAELTRSDLSAVLFQTFGCRSVPRKSAYPAIRKGCPSGGSLHPTEGYVLVRSAEGLAPGLYHYNVRSHALDLLRETSREEARRLALLFVAGQTYFADAQVLFLHVARLLRHTWKYRHHPKSHRVLLLDVGHLSQTMYLVCAARGLGAFFTAAMNDENIEEEFGLDPLDFCVMGVNGCGIPTATDPYATACDPYVPHQSEMG